MSTARAMTYEQPSPRPATQADIDALPPHLVGEIIAGALYTHARPARPHGDAHFLLGATLVPFRRGRDGPGGWLIYSEPELHLDDHILVPDLAAWRVERLPADDGHPFFTTPPDWVCEILSPSTERIDRLKKSRVYAQAGIPWLWLLDPTHRFLQVFKLVDGLYAVVQDFAETEPVKAQPFDAIEFALTDLWPDAEPLPPDE
jgi:Uma2 family endonuclease